MNIAIVGCGTMGKGIAQRLSATNQLYLYDHHYEKIKSLEKDGHGIACEHLHTALNHSEVIIIALKPQNLEDMASSIEKELKKDQIIISLLAGTPFVTLSQFFPRHRMIRMMPNLALIYGKGVIGLCSEEHSEIDRAFFSKLLAPLGKTYWLTEDKINALTALTGSGPAFFLVMVESMIDAGIAMGFSATVALDLIHQMLQGSLTLLEKTEKHPGELKWQIASPQGTTIAGIKTLEDRALRSAIMDTFLAAYDRANQLSANSAGNS